MASFGIFADDALFPFLGTALSDGAANVAVAKKLQAGE